MDIPPDERLKIVFDEALRALTQQQARLDNVRSRATTLTAAAALISSFVGSPILRARDFSWASVLALVAVLALMHWLFTAGLLFLVVELCALSIPLWSRWGAK